MTLMQPICLPCWRTDWLDGGMDRDPPRAPGWPEEHCCLCGRRTNNGIYVQADADPAKLTSDAGSSG